MPVITIVDPYTRLPVSFTGTEIGHSSTRSPDRVTGALPDRWNEQRAWKIPRADGTFSWKFAKYGYSLIYHAEGTRCRSRDGLAGSPADVDALPDDAEPCPRCRPLPPERLADAKDAGTLIAIRYEFPRIEITDCATPDDVIMSAALKRSRSTHQTSVMLSGPARELIAQCMADPDFRAGAGQLPRAV